jgi:DNA repair protein RadC
MFAPSLAKGCASGLKPVEMNPSKPGAADAFASAAVVPAGAAQAVAISPRIAEMPADERPRERLVREGPGALRVGELLAILLRTGIQGANAVAVGDALYQKFGSLESLARASHDDLRSIKGVGSDKAATLQAALELARRLARERLPEAPVLDAPDRIAALVREDAVGWNTERMIVISLNARYRLIRMDTVSEGLLDQVLIHAREVFRPAISAGAHSVVLVHNHPSGDPSPSEADIRVTRDMIRAGSMLRIEVLDHVIIGRPNALRSKDYTSLKELGHFYR